MSKIKFYDTCSLLTLQGKVFDTEDKFYISSITLTELENIKTSSTKDEEIKYKARTLVHLLSNNQDKYEIILYTPELNSYFEEFSLPISPDNKIIVSALDRYRLGDDIIFITQDLILNKIAETINEYNDAIKYATPKLYDIYVSLYIKNHTQESLSNELAIILQISKLLELELLLFEDLLSNDENPPDFFLPSSFSSSKTSITLLTTLNSS